MKINFSSIKVYINQEIQKLYSVFAPILHSHGNITSNGMIGDSNNNANKNVVTNRNGQIVIEDKPEIPTNISDLTNDSDFIEKSSTTGYIKNDGTVGTPTNTTYTADNSSLQLSNNQFSIKSNGVTSSHIADGTIVNADIASNAAIADSKIAFSGSKSGGLTPIDIGINSETSTNKLAFLPPANMTVQYSNSSATNQTYSLTDAQKTKILTFPSDKGFTLSGGGGVGTISTSDKVIVTLDAGVITSSQQADIYCRVQKLHLYFSTGNCTGCTVKVETATYAAPDTWVNRGSYNLLGNPAWNSVPINDINFGGYKNQADTSHNRYIRLTFSCAGITSGGTTRFGIRNIQLYADKAWINPSTLAETGHIYSYDENKNATFPAKIIKSGGTSSQFLKANGDIDNNTYLTTTDANNTFCKSNDSRLSDARQPKSIYISAGEGNVKDLDTYTTTGFYYNGTNAQAQYIIHCPNSDGTATPYTLNKAFFLLVEDWGTSNYTKQTLTYYYPEHETYIRTKNAGTWGKWYKLDVEKYNQCDYKNVNNLYLKIMRINITSNYADTPIKFTVINRRSRIHNVELRFVNQGDKDPQVREFYVKGGDSSFYIAKDGTSTWTIYYKKQEGYDNVTITDLKYNNPFNITFPNLSEASLPTSNILEAIYKRDNIGGNLLQGTKEFTTNSAAVTTGELYNGCVVKKLNGNNSNYQDIYWDIPKEQLELGGIYTLSFWAKTTATHGYVNTYFYQSNITSKRMKSNGYITNWTVGGSYGDGATQFYLNQAWTRYYVTYQLLDTGTFNANKRIAIRLLSNSSINNDLFIAGVKLEKGDQPTDYCENPKDVLKLPASVNVVTDATGKLTTEAKYSHPSSHPSTFISNGSAYGYIKSGETSSNVTLTTQKLINDNINSTLGNKLNKNADDTSSGYITAKGFKVSGKSNFLKADGTTADANNYTHPSTQQCTHSHAYSSITSKPSFTQDSNITSSTTGRYAIGTTNISGSNVTLYGKDTVYTHPSTQQCTHTHAYLPTNANGTTTGTLTATKFINSSSNNTNILLGNGNTIAQSTFVTRTDGANQMTDSQSSLYGNIGLSSGNQTQKQINTAINTKIGTLQPKLSDTNWELVSMMNTTTYGVTLRVYVNKYLRLGVAEVSGTCSLSAGNSTAFKSGAEVKNLANNTVPSDGTISLKPLAHSYGICHPAGNVLIRIQVDGDIFLYNNSSSSSLPINGSAYFRF